MPNNHNSQLMSRLLDWYHNNHRRLPWRETNDPYCIWISEIMLQQTRVETAIAYYQRFLDRFPDIHTLAQATEDQVLQSWQGLGYYGRARNLHKAARYIGEYHHGMFPNTFEEVMEMPGIGVYTAGAILSIAYNQPYPAVDGNVSRVAARLWGIEDDITQGATRRVITSKVEEYIIPERSNECTQAWMELGALVCTPRQPDCAVCPLNQACQAFTRGKTAEIPVKKKSDPGPTIGYWIAGIVLDGNLLMEYRQEAGLLRNMWGLPMVKKAGGNTPLALFHSDYNLDLIFAGEAGQVSHAFTHQTWDMTVLKATCHNCPALNPNLAWKSWQDTIQLAVPTAFRKVLTLLEKTAYTRV